jgi:MerR family mercuric resistance operon transcriptional regulator
MNTSRAEYTIGALARDAGVGVETIRFYQRKGLLPVPAKPYGGIRRYSKADAARLRFIRSSQRLGFTLDEIEQLLTLEAGGSCADIAELAERHLEDVRSRMAELRKMETALARLVRQCRGTHDEVACPLIASLQQEGA